MNDEQLHNALQARIPSPGDGYWESIEQQIGLIEKSNGFDEVDGEGGGALIDLPTGSGSERVSSRSRFLFVAASLVVVLGLGAFVLTNRTDDTADQLDVAVQPQDPSQTEDPSEPDNSPAPAVIVTNDDSGLVCYQSSNALRLDRFDQSADSRIRSPWIRVALQSVDDDGMTSLATWDDIPPGDDGLPVLLSAAVPTAPTGTVNLTFDATPMDHSVAESQTYQVIFGAEELTIGNVAMASVACGDIQPVIDRMFNAVDEAIATATPQLIETTPGLIDGETALDAQQRRLRSTSDLGIAGPFCFETDTSRSFLQPFGDEVFELRTSASILVGAEGQLDLVVRQGSEVVSEFAAIVPGMFNGPALVELSIVSAEGATWLDPPAAAQPIVLSAEALLIGPTRMLTVDCAAVEAELSGTRARAEERLAWLAENNGLLPIAWRFVEGPVAARAMPGVSSQVLFTWSGDERLIMGTGSEVQADGFVWVELRATDTRPASWVVKGSVIPDYGDGGPQCFANAETVMSVVIGSRLDSVRGTIRTVVEGQIVFAGVAGVGQDAGDRGVFEVNVLQVGAPEPELQQWVFDPDGMETSYGALALVTCADRSFELSQAADAVTDYPDPPQ